MGWHTLFDQLRGTGKSRKVYAVTHGDAREGNDCECPGHEDGYLRVDNRYAL